MLPSSHSQCWSSLRSEGNILCQEKGNYAAQHADNDNQLCILAVHCSHIRINGFSERVMPCILHVNLGTYILILTRH